MRPDEVVILGALDREVVAFPDDVEVWTTGPGKVNAAYGVSEMLQAQHPGLVVVVGTAAGFGLGPGLYRPGWAAQWDAQSLDGLVGAPVSPPERLPIPGGDSDLTIFTGDSFVTKALGRSGLVDMETYVYAYFLITRGVDFRVLKYVTDDGGPGAVSQWHLGLPEASARLWATVREEFL